MTKINLISNQEITEILLNLIHFKMDISTLKERIKKMNFDSDTELVIITRHIIKDVLKKALNNEISFSELEEWANLIECREDIGFENNIIQEVIFRIANPYLYGDIDRMQLRSIIKEIR